MQEEFKVGDMVPPPSGDEGKRPAEPIILEGCTVAIDAGEYRFAYQGPSGWERT